VFSSKTFNGSKIECILIYWNYYIYGNISFQLTTLDGWIRVPIKMGRWPRFNRPVLSWCEQLDPADS
jgi:hypothetical protein